MYYYGIEWLKTIACIGIIMMHMLSKNNNSYQLTGSLFEYVIPNFANFVFLFMTISAFGLCCGYYDRAKSGSIDWNVFYKKRYLKIIPFFSILVLLDIAVNHDFNAFIEAIPNLTLTRGLFENHINQIGVGWFLGLIFAFYLIFPFFCTLLNSRAKAWVFFFISLLLNYVTGVFYGAGRNNIVFCFCFFMAGGLVYLYKERIDKLKWWILSLAAVLSFILYRFMKGSAVACVLVSCSLLACSFIIHKKNKIVHFISDISMEIYLSHMFIFRVIEKLRLNTVLGNGLIQYLVTVFIVFLGAISFSVVCKFGIRVATNCVVRRLGNESFND